MRVFELRDKRLAEIKQESFGLEKIIQCMVEQNIESIFPGLEFVETEFQIDDLRPDTIAFDSDKNSFVIIEYKNIQNRSLIDQGVSYYQLLHERKADFVLLYRDKTNKTADISGINWDETRIIFVSPKYTKYQKRASGFQGLPIELYEIKKYQNNVFTLDRIGHSQTWSSNSVTPTTSRIAEFTEEDYLAGKYHNQYPTEEIKHLWKQLKRTIENTFDDVEVRQKKTYGGYYLQDIGSSICTLVAIKNKITLGYATKNMDLIETSEFVEDVSQKGHWGLGNFCSAITKPDDIQKAIPLIQKVYQSKKQK